MSTDKVSQWYDDNVDFEYKRLDLGRLEKEVTLHYIHEAIQAVREQDKREEGLKIADIGCGTGVYGKHFQLHLTYLKTDKHPSDPSRRRRPPPLHLRHLLSRNLPRQPQSKRSRHRTSSNFSFRCSRSSEAPRNLQGQLLRYRRPARPVVSHSGRDGASRGPLSSIGNRETWRFLANSLRDQERSSKGYRNTGTGADIEGMGVLWAVFEGWEVYQRDECADAPFNAYGDSPINGNRFGERCWCQSCEVGVLRRLSWVPTWLSSGEVG